MIPIVAQPAVAFNVGVDIEDAIARLAGFAVVLLTLREKPVTPLKKSMPSGTTLTLTFLPFTSTSQR